MANPETIPAILDELERALSEEHRALRILDRDAIEHAAEQKLALDARLQQALASSQPGPADLAVLQRVRHAALQNQLLIVHARTCLQSVLSMVTGDSFQAYPGATAKRAAPSALRLDVRV